MHLDRFDLAWPRREEARTRPSPAASGPGVRAGPGIRGCASAERRLPPATAPGGRRRTTTPCPAGLRPGLFIVRSIQRRLPDGLPSSARHQVADLGRPVRGGEPGRAARPRGRARRRAGLRSVFASPPRRLTGGHPAWRRRACGNPGPNPLAVPRARRTMARGPRTDSEAERFIQTASWEPTERCASGSAWGRSPAGDNGSSSRDPARLRAIDPSRTRESA